VLTGSKAEEGKTFEALLALDAVSGSNKKILIQLSASPDLEVWFAKDGKCDAIGKRLRYWNVPPPLSHVLKVCSRPSANRGFRLIASLYNAPGSPPGIVASDAIGIYTPRPLDSTWMAIFAAVLGFLSGILAEGAKKALVDFVEIRKTRASTIDTITKALISETTDNLKSLTSYLNASGGSPQIDPPLLSMGTYQTLMSDEGMLGYLKGKERVKYLSKLTAIDAKVGEYNDAARSFENGEVTFEIMKQKAENVRKILEKWQPS
jgi:hypothetical protein